MENITRSEKLDVAVCAWALWMLLPTNCGKGNLADCIKTTGKPYCSEKTRDERALQELNQGRIDEGIEILTALIEEEKQASVETDQRNYVRYTLLGAAYAYKAGFSFLDVASASFGSGGGSIIDQLATFLPEPTQLGVEEYQNRLEMMAKSVIVLQEIPVELRQASRAYSSSATLQLLIYQSARSII